MRNHLRHFLRLGMVVIGISFGCSPAADSGPEAGSAPTHMCFGLSCGTHAEEYCLLKPQTPVFESEAHAYAEDASVFRSSSYVAIVQRSSLLGRSYLVVWNNLWGWTRKKYVVHEDACSEGTLAEGRGATIPAPLSPVARTSDSP